MSDVRSIPDDVLRAMHASSRDAYAYFDGPSPAPAPGVQTYTRPDRQALAEEVLALRGAARNVLSGYDPLVDGRDAHLDALRALLPADPVERKA